MNVSIQNCVGDLIVGVLGDAGLGDGGGLRNWGVNSFVGDLVTPRNPMSFGNMKLSR